MKFKQYQVDEDISTARTLDTSFYTDPTIFDVSREKIFARGLHYVGDRQMLPENGWVHPVNLLPGVLDEPLVLVRDKSGETRCMSNVCTHRGNLLVTEPGKAGKLKCGYHGRIFDMDGKMTFMPEFEGVQNFPCKDDHLTKLPLLGLGPLLFTSLDEGIDSANYFRDMEQKMSFFPLDELIRRDDLSKDYYLDANWALYVENYLEGFHIPFVHDSLSQVLDFGDYETELYYPWSSVQIGIGKKDEHTFDLPAWSSDYGKPVAAYYFWVFPNMMFNYYPWGLSLNIVEPLTHNKTKISFITYMLDESKYNLGAGSDLDRVEMEDEKIVLQVQKGVHSRFYNQGRYSVSRERGTHHFHRLLAECLNG